MGIKNTIVKGFSLLKPIPLKDKIINYASLEVAVKGIFKEIKKKEPKITRTDVPEENSQSVFSGLGAFNLKNWLIDNYTALFNTRLAHGGYGGTAQTLFNLIETAKNSLTSLINGKENSFGKNNAFNKNFGTLTGTVLEGAKLAETLGLEYGGIVNNNSAKVAGKAYYCTANKAIYKCTQNNSLNYIDANYFEGLSNDKLLGKLQNLFNKTLIFEGKIVGGTGSFTESYKNFDFIDIIISLDSDTPYMHNHVERFPIYKNIDFPRFSINQWGIESPNWFQLNITNDTTFNTIGVSLWRIYGVKIN